MFKRNQLFKPAPDRDLDKFEIHKRFKGLPEVRWNDNRLVRIKGIFFCGI